MEAMRTNCSCVDAGSIWKEQAPDSAHRYKVVCGYCKKFIKWGANEERLQRMIANERISAVPYKEPPPRASLDEFFGD